MLVEALRAENAELLRRLEEAEETLRAIQEGSVDAFVMEFGNRVYTLEGADRPYRILVEQMQQGAGVLNADGAILYSNLALAALLQVPHEKLAGIALQDFIEPASHDAYRTMLCDTRARASHREITLTCGDASVPVHVTLAALSPERKEYGVLITDLTVQKHHAAIEAANTALRESEARLRHILDSAVEYAIITLDLEGRIAIWNAGARRLLGYDEQEVVGQPSEIFFTPEDRAAGVPEKEAQIARRDGRAVNERWHMRKDGSRFWGSGLMLPIEHSGRNGYLKIFRDQTAEMESGRRQALLIDELNHRVKNTLAVVQSFANQTLANATTLPDAREAFESRLLALAKAHDILTAGHWEGAEIRDLVSRALAVYRDDSAPVRIDFTGPQILLQPKAVLALSMALNELATNALKYGALSNGTGTVGISWSVDENNPQRFRFRWAESGGPPVEPPRRRGFGSRLVKDGLAQDLAGKVQLEFEQSGLVCMIDAPLAEVAGGGGNRWTNWMSS